MLNATAAEKITRSNLIEEECVYQSSKDLMKKSRIAEENLEHEFEEPRKKVKQAEPDCTLLQIKNDYQAYPVAF